MESAQLAFLEYVFRKRQQDASEPHFGTKGHHTNWSPGSFFHHPVFYRYRGYILEKRMPSSTFLPFLRACGCFREEILELEEHFSCRVFKKNKSLERRKM